MDFLYNLSDLLFQDISNLSNRSPEYVSLHRTKARILDQLSEKAGEELVAKLIDIQAEADYHDLLRCFLYGLQVGSAASHLG